MTVARTNQPFLVVECLPPEQRDTEQGSRALEGAHVVLVHGFASTPQDNWHRTRWVYQLHAHGATVHTVALPYHQLSGSDEEESSTAVSYRLPTDSRGLLGSTAEAIAGYLSNLSGDIHLVGYSVGARICWTVAALVPGTVCSLVAGAMPLTNHLPIIGQALLTGSPLPEDFAPILAGSSVPAPQLRDFATLSAENFSLSPIPVCPVLFFRGDRDTIASDSIKAYRLLIPEQATWVEYPGRDHINILTSGKLRAAVTDFMVRHRPVPASEVSQHTVA